MLYIKVRNVVAKNQRQQNPVYMGTAPLFLNAGFWFVGQYTVECDARLLKDTTLSNFFGAHFNKKSTRNKLTNKC